ncbi:gliding motility protein [Streptomyces sp. NPDC059874]|uniref:gliding motility protein n=1 Tax=Streptomyces sp. NPDC059874 TaxID=3346983 RepID=UPI00366A45AC
MTDEVAAEAPTAEPGAAEETETETADVVVPAAEAVEIPKQQSAEVAADSEAGEGART